MKNYTENFYNKKSTVFYDRFNLSKNIINFYETYKYNLQNIFEIFYNKISKFFQDNNINELRQNIKNEPIKIEEFNLQCESLYNVIILKNTKKENCCIKIDFLEKITIKFENKNTVEELWAFNYQLSIILASTNKYIYFYINEEEDNKNIDNNNISIISNIESIKEAIDNNKIIYSTNRDILNIKKIIEDIDKRDNNISDEKTIFKGVNLYNFEEIKDIVEKIKKLPVDILLEEAISISEYGYFIYNKNIGLTLKILEYFHSQQILKCEKEKYFYLNINRIKRSSNELLNVIIIYYLGNLFNDSKLFKAFYDKISNLFLNKIIYYDLLNDIIEEFIKFVKERNLKKKYYILFDNIYDKKTFEILNKIKEKFQNRSNNNLIFYLFVQLNNETVDFLSSNEFTFINNNNDIRPRDYIDSFINEDFNYEKLYVERIIKKLDNSVSKYDNLDKFILILKAKYITISEVNPLFNEKLKCLLENFSDFFHITCKHLGNCIFIDKIDFINDIVREIINDKFNSILCGYINKNELGIFDAIINSSVEGIFLEKHIILELISSLFIKKFKINRIYCWNDFKEKLTFDKNDNVIIIQKIDTSPIYDFAVIINNDGEVILKIYQIGLNKNNSDLEKLNKNLIFLDIEYFIKKLAYHYGIKISKFSFGIITSRNGYEKNKEVNFNFSKENNRYNNYKKMKEFCENNLFEFLIFDKNNKKFYIHNIENDLQEINFLKYKKTFIETEKEYIFSNISNLSKMYLSKKDYYRNSKVQELIGEYNKITYIGKFCTKDNTFPEIKGNNLYILWEDIETKKFFCYHNNNILTKDGKNQYSLKGKYFMICLIEGSKEINDDDIILTFYPKENEKNEEAIIS